MAKLKSSRLIQPRSYQFGISILQFASKLPKQPIYWTITDQLVRSATSIGANIVEAKSSSTKREFTHFYQIALKSGNETLYWLNLLRDSKLLNSLKLELLITECEEICKMIASSVLTLKKNL